MNEEPTTKTTMTKSEKFTIGLMIMLLHVMALAANIRAQALERNVRALSKTLNEIQAKQTNNP